MSLRHNADPIARAAIGALASYGPIPDEVGDGLVALSLASSDRKLRQAALNAAAALCGTEVRHRIWTLVDTGKPASMRVDALDALCAAPIVEGDIVERITAEALMRLPAPMIASATILIAIHRAVDDAVAVFEQVAHSNLHRALLLLGARAMEERDRTAALRILGLLAPGHPARGLLDVNGELLPRTVLDDLGDVRIRRYVRPWLQDLIAED